MGGARAKELKAQYMRMKLENFAKYYLVIIMKTHSTTESQCLHYIKR